MTKMVPLFSAHVAADASKRLQNAICVCIIGVFLIQTVKGRPQGPWAYTGIVIALAQLFDMYLQAAKI